MPDRSFLERLLKRMRYEAAMRGFDALNAIGLGRGWLGDRPGGRILVYHGLDLRGGSGFNARFISAAAFERQVAWMSAHFRIVSLEDYFSGVRDPKRLTVALTFDDGYATWLDLALPILERHHAPATFFVTAIAAAGQDLLWPDQLDIAMHLHRDQVRVRGEAFKRHGRRGEYVSISNGRSLKAKCKAGDWAYIQEAIGAFPRELTGRPPEHLAPYWRMLDAAGLRRLAASPLASIGSHGVRHTILTAQEPTVARAEMAEAKNWIEDAIGREVPAIAFPDGAWDVHTLETASALGYRQLLGGDTLSDSHLPHPSYRGRLTLNPFISWPNQIRCIYSGRYP